MKLLIVPLSLKQKLHLVAKTLVLQGINSACEGVPDSCLPGVNILVFLPNLLILWLMCWKILELIHASLLYAYLVESFCNFFLRMWFIKFSYVQNFFVSSSHVFAVKLLTDFHVYFYEHFCTFSTLRWASCCKMDQFCLYCRWF